MIQAESLFNISYGLYVVSSGSKEQGNAYVSNTVFQVTAQPMKIATCCSKNNFTCNLIEQSGAFSVSVLHKNTPQIIFTNFGYRSGKEVDKFSGYTIEFGITGVPLLKEYCICVIECKVLQKLDVGTHIIFIGEVVQTITVDDNQTPITYLNFREERKGQAPKNAPTYVSKPIIETEKSVKSPSYKCTACGYIYDDNNESISFDNLPHEWTCPVCGASKEDFIEL